MFCHRICLFYFQHRFFVNTKSVSVYTVTESGNIVKQKFSAHRNFCYRKIQRKKENAIVQLLLIDLTLFWSVMHNVVKLRSSVVGVFMWRKGEVNDLRIVSFQFQAGCYKYRQFDPYQFIRNPRPPTTNTPHFIYSHHSPKSIFFFIIPASF